MHAILWIFFSPCQYANHGKTHVLISMYNVESSEISEVRTKRAAVMMHSGPTAFNPLYICRCLLQLFVYLLERIEMDNSNFTGISVFYATICHF